MGLQGCGSTLSVKGGSVGAMLTSPAVVDRRGPLVPQAGTKEQSPRTSMKVSPAPPGHSTAWSTDRGMLAIDPACGQTQIADASPMSSVNGTSGMAVDDAVRAPQSGIVVLAEELEGVRAAAAVNRAAVVDLVAGLSREQLSWREEPSR